MSFRPQAHRRRHSSLNIVVAAAAIAVVGAGAVAFAFELGGHSRSAPPASSAAEGGKLPRLPVFSPTPPPPSNYDVTHDPLYGTGFPASWHIVIPVTRHAGSAVLPPFIPTGWIYVQYACVGTGRLQLMTADGTLNETLKPCSSPAHVVNVQISGDNGPLRGRPEALEVVTSPSVRWEMVVAETATPITLPTLPRLPENAKVLVPLTYGQGVAALPPYTPRGTVTMEWWCSGPGGMQVFISNGNESFSQSPCGIGGGGPVDYTGNRETLVVDVNPDNRWEILVYWQPYDSSG